MTFGLRWPQLVLLVVLLATGCSRPPVPAVPGMAQAAAGGLCRLGPRGTNPDAVAQASPIVPIDQGIGGTGHPARRVADGVLDQGIGGTGISPDPSSNKSRHLGVLGVITGFGSVCVDNLEIAYDSSTPIRVDGERSTAAALRAGQVVVLEADRVSALHAAGISVRHEVSGPIENLTPELAMIAGQHVRFSGAVWGAENLRRGAWVAVSGLRDEAGDIRATRIDPRSPGLIEVRGRLERGTVATIGELAVRWSPALRVVASEDAVDAVGQSVDGTLVAESIKPDLLATDPVAYFGPGVNDYVVETYATPFPGGLRLGGGLVAQLDGAAPAPGTSRRVVELVRSGDTRQLVAVSVSDVVALGPLGGPSGSAASAAEHPGGSGPGSSGASGGSPGGTSGPAGANPVGPATGGTSTPFMPAPSSGGSPPGGQTGFEGLGSGGFGPRGGEFPGGMFPGGMPGGLGGHGPGGAGGPSGR